MMTACKKKYFSLNVVYSIKIKLWTSPALMIMNFATVVLFVH